MSISRNKNLYTTPRPLVLLRGVASLPLTPLSGVLVTSLLFLLLTGLATNNDRILPAGPYTYDEADYMFAADKGFAANYTDHGSLPMSQFLAQGIKAGFNRSQWGQLSQFIRERDDITFYRHFHGPLYFYWLSAMRALGFTTEQHMRHTNLFLLFLCGLSFSILLSMALPGLTLLLFVPIIALFMFGPSMILTYNHLTPHGLYTMLSFMALGLLTLFIRNHAPRYWYGALMTASLALLTLEYTALLLFTMLFTLWLFRKSHIIPMAKQERMRFLGISVLCFFAPILVLWPIGLLKLTIVKNYLFYAYFTLIRGDLYGSLSTLQVWTMRIKESPIEYIACIGGIIAAACMRKNNRWVIPSALYAALILLTSIRNHTTFPQYFISAFPPLYLLAAAGWASLLTKKSPALQAAATGLLVCAVFLNFAVFYVHWAVRSLQRIPQEISSVATISPLITGTDQPILINREYIPTLHYYFPTSRLNAFNPLFESNEKVLTRITEILSAADGPMLLFWEQEDKDFFALLETRYAIEERRTLFLSPRTPNAVCYRLSRKQG